MNTFDNYRYPGSRPFQDTDLDRKLFFGRDEEKETFLHLVLAEKLVVLFAKSGMGKTSLLNAGVLQALRDRSYLPLTIRFNVPEFHPLQTIFTGIQEAAKQHNLEYTPGQETSVWEYFKTAEFWSSDDTLLTPVLIFDQFEDFFDFHSPEDRKTVIVSLAELIRGRTPQTSGEGEAESIYAETPPNIKMIIALREDYLAQLEELSRDIPDILHNRFRLTALTRKQAQEAIIQPARVQSEQITTGEFSYAPEAVEAMLFFLRKRKEQDKIVLTDEVEPFQLQLLCQDIESKIRQQPKAIIQSIDLGGESGMQRVLQDFYDMQIGKLGSFWKKRRVRRLCEKGFISASDRRLSLEVEDIARRFQVPKHLLAELVNSRVLRVEPRVGGFYYELSHDTLVKPIRRSQKKRQRQGRIVSSAIFIVFGIIGAFFFQAQWNAYQTQKEINRYYEEASQLIFEEKFESAVQDYQKIIELDTTSVNAYIELGKLYDEDYKLDEAKKVYELAIRNHISNARIYYQLGKVLFMQGQLGEAMKNYRATLQLNKNLSIAHIGLGNVYRAQKEFAKAETEYRKALTIDSNNVNIYKELVVLYIQRGSFDLAVAVYQQAIRISPEYADIYTSIVQTLWQRGTKEQVEKMYDIASEVEVNDVAYYFTLGSIFFSMQKYEQAIKTTENIIRLEPDNASAYSNIGLINLNQGMYDKAISNYQHALTLNPNDSNTYKGLGDALLLQGKYDEAISKYQHALTLNPNNSNAYIGLGQALRVQGKYDEAMTNYQHALTLNPNDSYAYVGLGEVLRGQGKYDEAMTNYQHALTLNPNDSSAYVGLGNILGLQGKYDEAISKFQYVLTLDPNDSNAYVGLGSVFFNQNKYDEAIINYQHAIKLYSKNIPAYNGLGGTLLHQGKYDEAMNSYQKALEIDHQDIISKANLAYVSLIVENFNNAFVLSHEILKEEKLEIESRLAMRFISISALLFQGKRAETSLELQEFITDYKSLAEDYGKGWDFSISKQFITNTQKISAADKALLLQLLDILESPKSEGDRKFQELETARGELLKQ